MIFCVDCQKYLAKLGDEFRNCLPQFVSAVSELQGGKALIEKTRIEQRYWEYEFTRLEGIALDLCAYMNFRAERENKRHEFDRRVYLDALLSGTREFFNVAVGDDGLIEDSEKPSAFQSWKAVVASQTFEIEGEELLACEK